MNLLRRAKYSLRRRIIFTTAVVLLVFFSLLSIGLGNLVKQSVLGGAQESLRSQILLLIGNIDVQDQLVVVPEVLSEARLSLLDSDLFAQIYSTQNDYIWRSNSSLDKQIAQYGTAMGEFMFFDDAKLASGEEAYVMTLEVLWEEEGLNLTLAIQVVEKAKRYEDQINVYRKRILLWLAILGVLLIALSLIMLIWSLKPLSIVSTQLDEIERGDRQRLGEDFPFEVSGLTKGINKLLDYEEKQISRHRDLLGNLAHSLKTPLAVLNGLDLYKQKDVEEVPNQLGTIKNIIEYQLQSSTTIGRRHFSQAVSVYQPTQELIRSLEKIYVEKQVKLEIEMPEDCVFFGDQGDWMELVGNLLDNAYKWTSSYVGLVVKNRPKKDSSHPAITLEVLDDGNGIKSSLKTEIMARGVRLDSHTPGHGLGLHIVKSIVDAYEGSMIISDRQPQGTRFTIEL